MEILHKLQGILNIIFLKVQNDFMVVLRQLILGITIAPKLSSKTFKVRTKKSEITDIITWSRSP